MMPLISGQNHETLKFSFFAIIKWEKKIARILSQASSLKKFELWSDEDFLFPVDRAAIRRSKKINGRRKNNLDCPSPRARSQARARSLLLRVLLLPQLRLHRCMCCYFRAHGARARLFFDDFAGADACHGYYNVRHWDMEREMHLSPSLSFPLSQLVRISYSLSPSMFSRPAHEGLLGHIPKFLNFRICFNICEWLSKLY